MFIITGMQNVVGTQLLQDIEKAAPQLPRFRVSRVSCDPVNAAEGRDPTGILSLVDGYHLLEEEPLLGSAILGKWRDFSLKTPPTRQGLSFRINTTFWDEGTIAFELWNRIQNQEFLVLSCAMEDHFNRDAVRCPPQIYEAYKILKAYTEQTPDDFCRAKYKALFCIARIPAIPKICIHGSSHISMKYHLWIVENFLQGRCYFDSFCKTVSSEDFLRFLNESYTPITKEFVGRLKNKS